MIRIPFLYRVIKRDYISSDEQTIDLIGPELKPIDTSYLEDIEDETSEEQENEEKVEINIEEIKEKIRKSIYEEMEEERNNILNEARIQGDKIKLEARKQGYKAGYKEGYQEGYNLGHTEGMDKAKEEALSIKDNALNLIKQSEEYVREYLKEKESQIIQLSVDMAESIVHTTIDSSSDNILMLIKPILQEQEEKESIVISCHPDNYPLVKERLSELKEINPNTRFIILEDGSLERNGCIIENEHQLIDLQIKKQIENILDEMENLE